MIIKIPLDYKSFLQGFVGTQAYMAPEVFTRNMHEGHGRAADIWFVYIVMMVMVMVMVMVMMMVMVVMVICTYIHRSTGCVVLEMVQGKRPWAELESNYQIMFKVSDYFCDSLDTLSAVYIPPSSYKTNIHLSGGNGSISFSPITSF